MAKTRVVHCKREPYDIYIGRPSKWGNPFLLWEEQDRAKVLIQYENYLRREVREGRLKPKQLKGKVLGCWCAPRLCHGDVLAAFAEGRNA